MAEVSGYERSEEIQWRVIWFPADKPHSIFTGTEAAVRKKAGEVAAWNPMIEKRTVLRSPWEDADG